MAEKTKTQSKPKSKAQTKPKTQSKAKPKPKPKAKRRESTKKREPERTWAQPTAPVDKLPEGFLPNMNPDQGRTY